MLRVKESATVSDMHLAIEDATRIPVRRQCLLVNGRLLHAGPRTPLVQCGIGNMSTVHGRLRSLGRSLLFPTSFFVVFIFSSQFVFVHPSPPATLSSSNPLLNFSSHLSVLGLALAFLFALCSP